jgi:hypothetical protein
MSEGPREELVEFLADHAGEDLRGVMRYDHEEYSFPYLREDVAERYAEERIADIVQHHREAEPVETRRTSDLALGNHHVTLRLYDEAALLHFPQGDHHGTIVSLDVAAARDFAEFTDACLRYLHRDSPQRIENLPAW